MRNLDRRCWLRSLVLDGYGREIFVEKEEKNGMRMVWYQRDKYGKLYRKTRRGTSIVYDLIEEPPLES